MLTSKQRAYLRGLANRLTPIQQVGKEGASPEAVTGLDEALEARELVKVAVLGNCEEPAKIVAEKLGGRTRSEVVQVVGNKIVFYRKSKKKEIITLP